MAQEYGLKISKHTTSCGPVYRIPFDKAIRHLLKSYDLVKCAVNESGNEDPVELCFSTDGAGLGNNPSKKLAMSQWVERWLISEPGILSLARSLQSLASGRAEI